MAIGKTSLDLFKSNSVWSGIAADLEILQWAPATSEQIHEDRLVRRPIGTLCSIFSRSHTSSRPAVSPRSRMYPRSTSSRSSACASCRPVRSPRHSITLKL